MNRQNQSIVGLALLGVMLIPTSLLAHTHRDQAQIQSWLNTLEQKSAEMRREAAHLESLNRSTATWRSHAIYLDTLKSHINEMGGIVKDLEDLKPVASDIQKRAIEAARHNLESLAAKTESAIRTLNDDRGALRNPGYKNTLVALHAEADQLANALDALGDYEDSMRRVAGLP